MFNPLKQVTCHATDFSSFDSRSPVKGTQQIQKSYIDWRKRLCKKCLLWKCDSQAMRWNMQDKKLLVNAAFWLVQDQFKSSSSKMVLENRGVTFGVHDLAQHRTREDYHVLKTIKDDTRSRLFGTAGNESTFNATTRAVSYGTRGHDPKGEYVLPRPRGTLELLTAEATWPSSVTGGFVIPFQGQSRSQSLAPVERTRRVGSLGRNIVGNCTIKDDRFTYYGPHSHYYGNNSGCRSTLQYRPDRWWATHSPKVTLFHKFIPLLRKAELWSIVKVHIPKIDHTKIRQPKNLEQLAKQPEATTPSSHWPNSAKTFLVLGIETCNAI